MARLKPGVSSYSRIAYAASCSALAGARTRSCSRATRRRRARAARLDETQLGKLEFARGRSRRARAPARALRTFPGYATRSTRSPGPSSRAAACDAAIARAAAVERFPSRSSSALSATCCTRPARRRSARAVRDRGTASGASSPRTASHRPRDGALRRRPRHPAARLTRTRAQSTARAAVDRRRRRAGLGARAQRPVRRGAALLEARAAARDEGRAKLFHRAEIERCLGNDPRQGVAQRLALNPHFSLLWTSTLRRLAS